MLTDRQARPKWPPSWQGALPAAVRGAHLTPAGRGMVKGACAASEQGMRLQDKRQPLLGAERGRAPFVGPVRIFDPDGQPVRTCQAK